MSMGKCQLLLPQIRISTYVLVSIPNSLLPLPLLSSFFPALLPSPFFLLLFFCSISLLYLLSSFSIPFSPSLLPPLCLSLLSFLPFLPSMIPSVFHSLYPPSLPTLLYLPSPLSPSLPPLLSLSPSTPPFYFYHSLPSSPSPGEPFHMSDHDDPHLAAGLLKMFLRELPEPALTFAAYDHMLELSREWSRHFVCLYIVAV